MDNSQKYHESAMNWII